MQVAFEKVFTNFWLFSRFEKRALSKSWCRETKSEKARGEYHAGPYRKERDILNFYHYEIVVTPGLSPLLEITISCWKHQVTRGRSEILNSSICLLSELDIKWIVGLGYLPIMCMEHFQDSQVLLREIMEVLGCRIYSVCMWSPEWV